MSIPILIFVSLIIQETSNSILIASTPSPSDSWLFLIALNPIPQESCLYVSTVSIVCAFSHAVLTQPVSMRQHLNLRLGRILAAAADGTDVRGQFRNLAALHE
jgi:hypothetical protein